MSEKHGILVIISGFSGAGKGTLMRELLSRYGDSYALSISATTRAPRTGEENGREYFFVSTEEFEEMIQKEALIEYAQYVGNYYGTPRKYVEEQLAAGRNVILEIEIQGALKVRKRFPETKLIFVTPPTASELKNRLVGRGTETLDVIEKRLARAYEESQGMEEYDYLLINDDLNECTEHLNRLITDVQHGMPPSGAAPELMANNDDFLNKMREELKAFRKENET